MFVCFVSLLIGKLNIPVAYILLINYKPHTLHTLDYRSRLPIRYIFSLFCLLVCAHIFVCSPHFKTPVAKIKILFTSIGSPAAHSICFKYLKKKTKHKKTERRHSALCIIFTIKLRGKKKKKYRLTIWNCIQEVTCKQT